MPARQFARGKITGAQLRAQLVGQSPPSNAFWEHIENERARSPRFAYALARIAFEIAGGRRDASLRARAQLALIQTLNTLGEFPDALALCEETAARLESARDAENAARVWLEAAAAEVWRGNLDKALLYLERFRNRASLRGEGEIFLAAVGWFRTRILSTQGAWNQALDCSTALLAQLRNRNDLSEAQSMCELGRVQIRLNPADAVRTLRETQAKCMRHGYRVEHTWCTYYLAQARMDLGDFRSARHSLTAVQGFAKREGMRFLRALSDLEMGALALFENDFELAVTRHEQAHAVFTSLGVIQEASSCEVNLSEIFNQLNRFADALPYAERALQAALATGGVTKAAVCHENLSRSYSGLGDAARAIANAKQARELYAAQKMDLRLAECDLKLGAYHAQIGQFPRAHQFTRRARREAQRGQSPSLIAQADLQAAQLVLRRGARAAAHEYLARARAQFQSRGQAVFAALAERLLAQTQIQRRSVALGHLQSSRRCFAKQKILVEMALCDLARGDLHRAWGEPQAAARAYQRAQTVLVPAFPDHAWRAAYGLARIAQDRGDDARASSEYMRAAAMIASLRAGLVIETWSNDLFHARRHVFADAVKFAAQRSSTAETLRLIEIAKAQVFLRQLRLREWRTDAGGSEELNALLARERVLRERLLQQRKHFLLDTGPDTSSSRRRGNFGQNVAAVSQAANAYEAHAERVRLARHGLKGNPALAPFSLDEFRAYAYAQWGGAWTALDYFFANGNLYIACVDAKQVRVHATRWTISDDAYLAQATSNHPDLRELIYNGTLHGKAVPARSTVLPALAARLLPDDLPETANGHTLIFSPHAELHQLPFHALYRRGAQLLEQFTCVSVPNLQTLVELERGKSKRTYGRTLVRGVESFSDAPMLAHTRRETESIARKSKRVTTLWQAEATREKILDLNRQGALARYDVLHFATHALVEPNAPHVSRVLLGGGVLSALDIAELKLDARLVTLSACSSAKGKGGSGDEVLGLARAFFYAGARAVVASLWNVDDASTAALMQLFYRNLAMGKPIGKALREAQLEMKRQGFSAFHWGAFLVMGQG